MRGAFPLAVAVGLLAAALPLAAAQDAEEPPLTDPEGDARWFTTGTLAGQALTACGAGGEITARACSNVPPVPDAGGTQAPPVLDIVSADVRVEDGRVVGELRIASLTDPIAPLSVGDEITSYSLYWSGAGGVQRDGFGLNVWRVNGTTQYDGYFGRGDERCVRVFVCYFEPELEVLPGTPGTIRWTMPHAALPLDTLERVVLTATTSHWQIQSAAPLRQYEYTAEAQDQRVRGWSPSLGVMALADVAGPGRETALGPPPSWSPVRDGMPSMSDVQGDGMAGERADLDILHVELAETERTLTVSTTLARVDEDPLDHIFVVHAAPTTGASVTAGYSAVGGARTEFHGACEAVCGPAHEAAPLARPPDVSVVPGEPGYVNVTFARADLGNPGAGDAFSQFFVAALLPDAFVEQETPVGHVENFHRGLGDFAWDFGTWWFTLGPDRLAGAAGEKPLIEDPQGDVSSGLSLAAVTTSLAPFDILSVRASSTTAGIFRVELGIDDLSDVEPPRGYTAVFYAVGFGTEQGPIMVGYFEEPSTAKQQFFCAPDTAVIARPEGDPQKVIWQPIQGLLSVVRERAQVGGGSTPGSIVFLVPSSCFNLAPDADLPVETLAAATFLLDGAGNMLRVDEAQSEGPVTILAAQAPSLPWYERTNWDILGILVAIAIALVGAIAIRRKRGALRRYLHEIERVLQEHPKDARDREKALLAIQLRLRDDLLRNRITESHFVIVERRLDQQLSRVRIQALGDAFGDLPHRLLLTLQQTLRDGAMSTEDWKLFRTQLESESHLTRESRAAIERRVEAWVKEEAATTAA